MMYKKDYRVFVEKIKAIMERYGEVTTKISSDESGTYYLDNTPCGKLSVYINEFKVRQNTQYMCLKFSEPTKIPKGLDFNSYNGKCMNWCPDFNYLEKWFESLIVYIFEMEV